jgi:hypothetical protein
LKKNISFFEGMSALRKWLKIKKKRPKRKRIEDLESGRLSFTRLINFKEFSALKFLV